MNQKRTNFIEDANKTVADALRRIRKVGDLANQDRYSYTDSDVNEIVAALNAEVARTSSKFARGSKVETKRFRLSSTTSLTPVSTQRPERWKLAYAELLRRRVIANEKLRKIRSKPFASDKAADYLLKGIAKALVLPYKPADVDQAEWALADTRNIIILDAKKAAQTFKPSLEKAPQSMIRGRLITIQTFAPEVSAVQVFRAPKALPLPRTVDPRYAVVLYRGNRPPRHGRRS